MNNNIVLSVSISQDSTDSAIDKLSSADLSYFSTEWENPTFAEKIIRKFVLTLILARLHHANYFRGQHIFKTLVWKPYASSFSRAMNSQPSALLLLDRAEIHVRSLWTAQHARLAWIVWCNWASGFRESKGAPVSHYIRHVPVLVEGFLPATFTWNQTSEFPNRLLLTDNVNKADIDGRISQYYGVRHDAATMLQVTCAGLDKNKHFRLKNLCAHLNCSFERHT